MFFIKVDKANTKLQLFFTKETMHSMKNL